MTRRQPRDGGGGDSGPPLLPQPPRWPPVLVLSLAAYSLSFVVFGLQVNLLGPTASALAARVGVHESDLGVVFFLNGLASIVGGLPSGYLVDNLPGHLVLAIVQLLQAAFLALMPNVRSLGALAAAFGCCALSWNIVNSAGNTFTLWAAAEVRARALQERRQRRQRRRQRGQQGGGDTPPSLSPPEPGALQQQQQQQQQQLAGGGGSSSGAGITDAAANDADDDEQHHDASHMLINLVNAMFGLGSLLAPVAAEYAAQAGAELNAYRGAALLTAAAAVPFLLLPSPTPPTQLANGSGGGDVSNNNDNGSNNNGAEQQPEPQQHALGSVREWCRGSRAIAGFLAAIAAFGFLNVGSELAIGGFIFSFALLQGKLTESEAHLVNSCYWLMFTVGRVVASAASMAWPPEALLYGSLPLAVAGAAAALALPPAALTAGWPLLGVAALLGLGASAGFANSLSLLDRVRPCTGAIAGLLGGIAGAGCMVVPLLVAQLAKHTAFRWRALPLVMLVSFLVQLALVPLSLRLSAHACAAERRLSGGGDGDGGGGGGAAAAGPKDGDEDEEGGEQRRRRRQGQQPAEGDGLRRPLLAGGAEQRC